jgi:hypothetical protein
MSPGAARSSAGSLKAMGSEVDHRELRSVGAAFKRSPAVLSRLAGAFRYMGCGTLVLSRGRAGMRSALLLTGATALAFALACGTASAIRSVMRNNPNRGRARWLGSPLAALMVSASACGGGGGR